MEVFLGAVIIILTLYENEFDNRCMKYSYLYVYSFYNFILFSKSNSSSWILVVISWLLPTCLLHRFI